MSYEFTGYSLDHIESDKETLSASAIGFACGSLGGRVNEVVDPRPYVTVEHQGSLSSCTGASVTSGMEVLWGFQAGDFSVVQPLSKWWAYRVGQIQWLGRNHSADNGCTIDAICTAMGKVGCCLERSCPYPSRYVYAIPNAYEEAAQRRIGSHSICEDFDQGLDWLDSVGFIHIGIQWTRAMAGFRGLAWSMSDVRDDGSRGGHAMSLIGYVKHQGEDHMILVNSHGKSWGTDGFALVSRKVFDYIISRNYTVMAMCSALSGVERKKRVLQSFTMG